MALLRQLSLRISQRGGSILTQQGPRPNKLLEYSMRAVACGKFHSLAELPDTHEMLRKTCRDFADERLKPFAAEFDKNHQYPAEQVGCKGG